MCTYVLFFSQQTYDSGWGNVSVQLQHICMSWFSTKKTQELIFLTTFSRLGFLRYDELIPYKGRTLKGRQDPGSGDPGSWGSGSMKCPLIKFVRREDVWISPLQKRLHFGGNILVSEGEFKLYEMYQLGVEFWELLMNCGSWS